LHLFSEVIAKDRSAIPQQVARELVKGKCLAELLSNPLRGRVGGHIEVQNATESWASTRKT
jgi:predicted transcriptional regulator